MTDFSDANKRERVENLLAALWGHDSTRYEPGGDRDGKADSFTEAYAYLNWTRYATPEERAAGFDALTIQRKRNFVIRAIQREFNNRIFTWRQTMAVEAAKAGVIVEDDEDADDS